jgi:hypothetical protein
LREDFSQKAAESFTQSFRVFTYPEHRTMADNGERELSGGQQKFIQAANLNI